MNCDKCGMYFAKIRQFRKHKHCYIYGCNGKGFHNNNEYKNHLKKVHNIE